MLIGRSATQFFIIHARVSKLMSGWSRSKFIKPVRLLAPRRLVHIATVSFWKLDRRRVAHVVGQTTGGEKQIAQFIISCKDGPEDANLRTVVSVMSGPVAFALITTEVHYANRTGGRFVLFE